MKKILTKWDCNQRNAIQKEVWVKDPEDQVKDGGVYPAIRPSDQEVLYSKSVEVCTTPEGPSWTLTLSRDPSRGPATIHYYPKGIMSSASFLVDGELHNPYGPAIILQSHPYRPSSCDDLEIEQYFYWKGDEIKAEDHIDFLTKVDELTHQERKQLILESHYQGEFEDPSKE